MPDEYPHKYGVALDDELDRKINRHVAKGESRSARIRQLIRLGIVYEDIMLDNQWWPPDQDEREYILAEAIRNYIDEELD